MAPLPRSDTQPILPHICATGLHLGSLPSTASFSTRTCPLPMHPPSDWLRLFLSQTFPCIIQQSHPSYSSCLHRLWRWNIQSVLKRWHIKFRRWVITQKKEHNICILVRAVKTHTGGRSIAPLILNLGTRRRWVISFTTQQLSLGKETEFPLNRWLDGLWSQSRHFRKGKNFLLLLGIEPQIIQSVPQSLYWLSYLSW